MRIIGVDPGLANLGLADMRVENGKARIAKLGIVHTEPPQKARHLRAADTTTDRLRTIAREVFEFIAGDPYVALAIEVKAIPFRDGRMMTKPSTIAAMGRVRGLFDGIAASAAVTILEEPPDIVKKLVAGERGASKDQVIEAVTQRFPELEDLWPKNKGDREHVADAVGMCIVALDSDLIRAVLRHEAA